MFRKIALIIVSFLFVSNANAAIDGDSKGNAPTLLVISCSLNPESNGALIANYVFNLLKSQGQKINLLDLRNYKLPIANGHDQSAYQDAQVKEIHDKILEADGIILIAPIYNFGVGATGKNLIELTGHPYKDVLSGKAWKHKPLGFIGVSGSPASLMAPLSFLNSMMLDFKTHIIPSFVMLSRDDFKDKNEFSADIKTKVEKLTQDVIRFAKVLSKNT